MLNRAALDPAAAIARRSALVANDVARLAAQSARCLQQFEAANAARSMRRRAGLRNGREIEPIRDAFVAERRPVHAPDKGLNPFCSR
jgi:hypothetical protein